jgi:hypothetical protein
VVVLAVVVEEEEEAMALIQAIVSLEHQCWKKRPQNRSDYCDQSEVKKMVLQLLQDLVV